MKALNYQSLLKKACKELKEHFSYYSSVKVYLDGDGLTIKTCPILPQVVIEDVVNFCSRYRFYFYVTSANNVPLIRLYR